MAFFAAVLQQRETGNKGEINEVNEQYIWGSYSSTKVLISV